jgi:hypothetical protein
MPQRFADHVSRTRIAQTQALARRVLAIRTQGFADTMMSSATTMIYALLTFVTIPQ